MKFYLDIEVIVVDGWNTCKEIDCGCSESGK